jgi:hypothetical protein
MSHKAQEGIPIDPAAAETAAVGELEATAETVIMS